MVDPTPHPGTGDDTGVGPGCGSPPGMPRWVKVSGIIVIVLVLLFVVLQLTGLRGGHGPGRHTDGGDTPPTQHGP
ncbi:MAG: hypothetical protein HYY00_02610 [Chloroflexi bacterium]|nr:hypothetical protein [Chloroflexota bacterium]